MISKTWRFALFALMICASGRDACGAEVAVVDIKKVISECEAGKDIDKQVDSINETKKKKLLVFENQIKDMSKASDALQRSDELESLQIQLYELVKTAKLEIEEAHKEAIVELLQVVNDVVQEIAKENSFKLVVNKEAVIYCDDNCDQTNSVIRRVNDRTKHISVKVKEK